MPSACYLKNVYSQKRRSNTGERAEMGEKGSGLGSTVPEMRHGRTAWQIRAHPKVRRMEVEFWEVFAMPEMVLDAYIQEEAEGVWRNSV